jgi:hypothetical protein
MNLLDDLIYVGIIGSRRRDEAETYFAIRAALMTVYVPERTVIISGGCPKGGDRFAEMIAAELGMPRQVLRSDVPDKSVEGRRIMIHMPDLAAFASVSPRWRSTRANYARNGLIARDSRDHLIASVAADRAGGTEDTIKKYERIHKRKAMLV